MTAYFHFMFTTLDLSVVDYAPSANVTAIQVFAPDSPATQNLIVEFNYKNIIKNKPILKFLPVSLKKLFYSELLKLHVERYSVRGKKIFTHNFVEQIQAISNPL